MRRPHTLVHRRTAVSLTDQLREAKIRGSKSNRPTVSKDYWFFVKRLLGMRDLLTKREECSDN
jgi:hypothetical protein